MNIVPITLMQRPYPECTEILHFTESANDLSLNATEQLEQILNQANIHLALEGCSQKHLLSVSMYLKNFDDIQSINSLWYQWKSIDCKATRACFKSEIYRPDCLVEVSFMVCLNHLQVQQPNHIQLT